MLRIAVVGSRSYRNYPEFASRLETAIMEMGEGYALLAGELLVVSGGAPGPDSMAVKWAKARSLPRPEVIRPKWRREDGSIDMGAGFARNTEIVAAADLVIAFWDGTSRGTKDSIRKAEERGKRVRVERV